MGALAISLFIYTFYRSDKTVINELIIAMLSFEKYAVLKGEVVGLVPLPNPIVYSLPGGLWIFCVTVLAGDFYFAIRTFRLPLSRVPIVFAIGLELCQFVRLTNGRFDGWDIASYGLFWLLALFSFRTEGLQQNIISPFTLDGFICVACFLSVYLAHVNP